MKRVPTRRAEIGISLFPFLAVLICTMGALIVLLVLVVQQARVQADTICDQMAEQLREQRLAEQQRQQQDEEDYRWKQEILRQQRAGLTEQLADGRLQLGHLEDHIRRLDRRWTQLQAEYKDLQADGGLREEDRDAARRELARLQSELDAERERLTDARQQLGQRQRAFSIIPYEGPHGTRRRPIYIECRESGIIIQPEGIVLGPQDLAGPLGPGNPLDASLRAIREYWSRAEGQSKFGEPYPLLIVRSDGAVAYSMARAAMANWDDEFGYELVGADTALEFPPSDPQLRGVLEATVQAARQRQAILAAAMPKRFSAPSPESFRVGDAAADWNDDGPAHRAASDTAPSRNGFGIGGIAASGSTQPAGMFGTGQPSGTADAAKPRGREENHGPGTNTGSAGQRGGSGEGPANGRATGAEGAAGSGPAGRGSPSGTGASGGSSGPSTAAGGGSGASSGPSAGAGGGSAASSGPSAGTGGGSAGPAGPAGANSAGASASVAESTPLPDSIARQRGPNWALPNAALTSTGITRPIQVECHSDRLVILPDRGDHRDPQVFAVQGAMRGAIPPFVAGIWSHTERWGMAVAGGYWKPVIRVQVAPDAHARFLELRALLQDSGIEVEQR
jgi:hypothetical protein